MSLSCSFLRGQRVLPSWMGGGGRLFLFNPLCSDGNAVGRFNKSSRYCFHITGCKLTEHVNGQTNGSAIRGSVRHDLLLSGNKKEVTAFMLLFGNPQREIGEINALSHSTVQFKEKHLKRIIWIYSAAVYDEYLQPRESKWGQTFSQPRSSAPKRVGICKRSLSLLRVTAAAPQLRADLEHFTAYLSCNQQHPRQKTEETRCCN